MTVGCAVDQDVGLRIAKNSLYNIIRALFAIPIIFFITPYIVRRIGTEEFGLWALVGVITSYAQLSDFGINESLIKFFAEYKARNDVGSLNQLINTAFVSYLALGIIFYTLFIFLLPFVVHDILDVPARLQTTAIHIFSIALVLFFINMFMGVFGSLLVGFEQMRYSSAISIISTILLGCGTFIFLSSGYGLSGLIYNNALITIFVTIANVVVARRLFPQMELNPFRYFSKATLKQIAGFSWKVQVSNITQLMIFQIDVVLLSHFVGLTAVGFYEIANRIAQQARGFISTLFSPMIPAASALHAHEQHEQIAGLYRRSFKYMSVAAVPLSLAIFALAHPFIRTWIGAGYETSSYTLQALMAAYMINLLTGPGAFILSGINKPEIGMRSSIMAGLTNIILCFTLVQSIGYYGIVIGIFTSLLTSALYFLWMVSKQIPGADWVLYRQTLTRPLVAAFLCTILVLSADQLLHLKGYIILSLLVFSYLFIIYRLIFAGSYLDEFDRQTIKKLIPLRLRTHL
jgi:O-antigen/teichoic acid export membrane protein